MSFIACGINHKTAPLRLREKLSFRYENMSQPLTDFVKFSNINEVAILSTCNRTELYSYGAKPQQISDWFAQCGQLGVEDLQPSIYSHTGEAAVKHVIRVASGLDSMILGEPQILGQMKAAYNIASRVGTAGSYLQKVFQHVFSVTKQVRSDTQIGAFPVSTAYAAINLSKRIFSNLANCNVLLVGAGEIIELAAKYLYQAPVNNIIIANRTIQRAKNLAEQFNGQAIAFDEIPRHLKDSDIIISGTASPLPILGKGSVESAIKARRHKPMFMVDLAVPRDIEAEVGNLSDVYLYCIDDLQDLVADGLSERQQAAKQAEEMIEQHAATYTRWEKSLDSVSTVCCLRDKLTSLSEQVLQKAHKQLKQGIPIEQVLDRFARDYTNKILHHPSTQLRRASEEGDDQFLETAQQLFDLDVDKDK